jgi:two-component system, response regulator PdtaR
MEAVASLPQEVESRRKVVLYVEDEFRIRWTTSEYLRDVGFHVIEATSAHEAIEVVSCLTQVDIVFCDIHLIGEITGHVLSRWLAKYHPHIGMLLTSGDSSASALIATGPTRAFVPKPYILADLQLRMDDMMARRYEM